jgi:hypothetical protein
VFKKLEKLAARIYFCVFGFLAEQSVEVYVDHFGNHVEASDDGEELDEQAEDALRLDKVVDGRGVELGAG